MPIFTNATAIWGSLIFLLLIAVYIYRRRSRTAVVSTLMFFSKSKSTAEGGQKLHKLQTPFIFFLEMLIFLFFLLALANPISLHRGQLIPITIVLDDSFSMTAGGEKSARSLGLQYLKREIFSKSVYRITLIKAGNRSKILGRRDMNSIEAENALIGWNCESVSANLMEAVAQSIETSSEDSTIVVLTDHLNEKSNAENIKWISFGTSRDNIAITAANRSSNGRIDRCFFEFTNFSKDKKEINAEIIDITNEKVLEQIKSSFIEPNSSRRIIVKVTNQKAVIKAVIKNDEIDFDNEAILLPVKNDKLKVSIRLKDKVLSDHIEKAVLSSDLAYVSNDKPQVVISDRKIENTDSILTQVIIHNATSSYFVAKSLASDKNHFITSDLPLDEAIWVADSNFKPFGKIILVSSGIPLICVNDESNYLSTIYFNYCFDKSNMHLTTFWPVFFYNILDWAMLYKSGPTAFNFRSGSRIDFRANKGSTTVYLKKENSNNKIEGYVNNGKVAFIAGVPGIYTIEDGEKQFNISVNLCSYEESNMTNFKRTENLPEIFIEKNMNYFKSVKWWFIMIAFALLLLHQWLISRRRSGYAF